MATDNNNPGSAGPNPFHPDNSEMIIVRLPESASRDPGDENHRVGGNGEEA